MTRLFLLLLVIGSVICFSSCDEETQVIDLEEGMDYFPLEIGHNLIYEVDSINFITGGTIIDSTHTFVRENVVDTLLDNEGNTLYKIERFERKSDTLDWNIRDVWTASKDANRAFRTEENLRFVKLIFPLKEERVWESTAFIDKGMIVTVGGGETMELFKNWESEVLSVNQLETIGGIEYPEVATISHADSENLIEYRYVIEKYAKNVGLVYREMWILNTQNTADGLTWREKAEKGFILRQTLISN